VTITGTVSFGKKLWTLLTANNENLKGTGAELFDFPGYAAAPSTQADLYVHIHSKSNGACYDCGQEFISLFQKDMLTFADEKMGFVWRDSRDLTGFIDGTENPAGVEERTAAALTADGCSYVMVQRFVHNLDKWAKLDVATQESIIGRTKKDSVQLSPLPHISHVAHSDITIDGKDVKIVRHSLPYGMPDGTKGLWFTSYCSFIKGLDEIEKSLFGLRGVEADSLMSYITPVTGGFYFVPSSDMIEKL
jgi:putative iron-dependent peroxidase